MQRWLRQQWWKGEITVHISSVFASANHRWKLTRWTFSKTSPLAWTCCTLSRRPACSTEAHTSVRSTQRDTPLSGCTSTCQVKRKATHLISTVGTATNNNTTPISFYHLYLHIFPLMLSLSQSPPSLQLAIQSCRRYLTSASSQEGNCSLGLITPPPSSTPRWCFSPPVSLQYFWWCSSHWGKINMLFEQE